MIDGGLVAEDLGKALYVIAAPAFVHFSVAAELVAHQIVRALDACDGEPIRLQGYESFTGDSRLRVFQELLDIPHGRIQHLTFMQPVAIPGAQLILPVQLPFGKCMFFQQVMRLDDDKGSRRFKSYTPLDADDS